MLKRIHTVSSPHCKCIVAEDCTEGARAARVLSIQVQGEGVSSHGSYAGYADNGIVDVAAQLVKRYGVAADVAIHIVAATTRVDALPDRLCQSERRFLGPRPNPSNVK